MSLVLKIGGPGEPQGLLSQRPASKLTPKPPAKDITPRVNPAAQHSQAQSVKQDKLTSAGLEAQPSPFQPAKPVFKRQDNSESPIQPEYEAPPQAQTPPLGPEQHRSSVEEGKTQPHPQLK